MPNDFLFDQLDQHFHEKIYRSFKGRLRLLILNRDIENHVLNNRSLEVLDIGGGSGVFSLSLAQKNNHITLIEPSKEMIQHAQLKFKHAGFPATFIQSSAEEICQWNLPQYDLILLHAILEWTHDPFKILEMVIPYLKSGGYISLLFYNQYGLMMHNLIRGNFRVIDKLALNHFKREEGSLTPVNPLKPDEIMSALETQNLRPIHKSGIRIFHDYMSQENKQKIDEADHISMEMRYSMHPEFMHTARYLHWIYQK